MTTLRRLIFLVHPLAHAPFSDAWAQPFIACERELEPRWWAAAERFGSDEAVAVVTGFPRGGAGMELACDRATAILGDRCFVLREPDFLRPDFWQFPDDDVAAGVFDDVRAACVGQGTDWNKEEFETSFHTRRCTAALQRMAKERGFAIDPAGTKAEAWGEVYEGCALKYPLNFRRLLGLTQPIEPVFDMIVPAWRGLLGAQRIERRALDGRTVVDIFATRRGATAMFSATAAGPGDRAWQARLPRELAGASVVSVRDKRLWPGSGREDRRKWPLGNHEPDQPIVREVDGALELPVATGLVYQLAKGAVHVRAPRGMKAAEFIGLCARATVG